MAAAAAGVACRSVRLLLRRPHGPPAAVSASPSARRLTKGPRSRTDWGRTERTGVTVVRRAAAAAATSADDTAGQKYQLAVPRSADDKLRLDVYLADSVPDVTRARLQACIKDGLVSVNRVTRSKPGFKVRPGDEVAVRIKPPPPLNAAPEAIPLDIVFEDEHLLVINKEAGMVTHPAPGNYSGTLVNAVLNHCSLPTAEVGNDGKVPQPRV
mmetsp:Transcript_38841/g.100769  ORF Transcript_38841/g.100769 Transcript_38841/m.100769 type:complete len:212 (+) Transcript_38841:112-747(+)